MSDLDDLLAPYRRTFEEQGDYGAFMHALLVCCWNDLPLPKWVAAEVIKQASDAAAHASTGKGKQGNWRALERARMVDKVRAGLAHVHLRPGARGKQVRRGFVSGLGAIYGYDKPPPKPGGARIVTRKRIFEHVSKQLAGTLARGSATAIEESYKKVKRAGGLRWDDAAAHERLIKSNRLRAKAELAKPDKQLDEAGVREQERLSRGGE